MTRPIPKIAVDFVAAHEGLRLKAYLDSAGIPTLGYGHIEGVKMGDTCTQAQALAWLREDMHIAVRKLYSVLKPSVIDGLTTPQYAALLSFTYNLGAKASWTIWKRINAGELDRVPVELMKFVNAGGRRIKGLVNRRADECKLWSESDPDHEVPPSSVTRQPGMTPPVPMEKPVAASKTFWTGAGVAASGVVAGAQQVQAIAAPQAVNSDLIAKLAGIAAVLIVAGGIAIMVFRWIDARAGRQ